MVDRAENTLKAYDAIAPLYAEYSEKYQAYLSAIDQLMIDRLTQISRHPRAGGDLSLHLESGKRDSCLRRNDKEESSIRLLDVGSGDGRRLKKITDAVGLKDVVSVEPSTEMAALCRQTTGFPVHQMFGDALAELHEAPFDTITALWNVFGHMPSAAARLKTLQCMREKLKPGGIIMLDVNNRHNQLAYGRMNVLKRRIIDALCFKESRGDAHYEWKIGNQSFPASGHLFTPAEMQRLFAAAGLKIIERWSVNYTTGAVSASPLNGQLFYVLGLGG